MVDDEFKSLQIGGLLLIMGAYAERMLSVLMTSSTSMQPIIQQSKELTKEIDRTPASSEGLAMRAVCDNVQRLVVIALSYSSQLFHRSNC